MFHSDRAEPGFVGRTRRMRQTHKGQPVAEWCASPNAMRLNKLLRMSRRDVLLGGIGLSVASTTGAALAADTAPATPNNEDLSGFMQVSQRLTDRDTLNPQIGAALYANIVHANADRKDRLNALHALLEREKFTTASAFAHAAEKSDPKLKDVIHEILTGWYRGIADGKVVVYRSALMFDITKDAVYPKTYATGGPFYWTSKPPEVARPKGHPALSASALVIEPT
ncbi:sorbitol dehydrogenase family protein [Acetobacter pasteurianus]|uniref:Sorbitol dehydrogenase small subunit n=2 Tax=Acetobacter pasteurianus TaxID=438 RepID=C7JEG8_ACEP3|nr:sorbitol dehydrogenase family protein [Acetobacter pasteurianus]BAI00352.1 sorbitol dehydrogenase small subunit [Acetobacter pasteurianus IFO 3283-01]BAI03403.1 sorbitol dehydrogenase small subunit [Acetobacter pasteurianus IFO 3283-03]BAI06448.1 sorbitol dehydrogenase small subunit [Acetobacter pasteurianus IFO 3283-07]BAI09498.1 sorbitol dehydrogenase small subunit [Acetobacter pasteurianus IFO 3283-22]BAI12546.1 sorbitol dehydrogenase small subunit [Acetobacter pasteurianus IFO 3283-26]